MAHKVLWKLGHSEVYTELRNRMAPEKNRSLVLGPRKAPILDLSLYTQEASYPVVCWQTLATGFLGEEEERPISSYSQFNAWLTKFLKI